MVTALAQEILRLLLKFLHKANMRSLYQELSQVPSLLATPVSLLYRSKNDHSRTCSSWAMMLYTSSAVNPQKSGVQTSAPIAPISLTCMPRVVLGVRASFLANVTSESSSSSACSSNQSFPVSLMVL